MQLTRTMAGLDQAAVRRVNTAVVLRALALADETTTLFELSAQTRLSRRTVELIVNALSQEGWITEDRASSSGGAGRPARRLRFVSDRVLVAGVRIDTDTATAVIADIGGRILARAEQPLGQDYFDPALTVALAASAVEVAVERSGLPLDRVRAGAVAAGGVIGPDGAVRRLVNAPRWTGFPLAAALTERFGVPWVADNDANFAALAEHRDGIGRDRRTLAWILLGRRVGAGFIVNGEVHRGANGAAGELIESSVLGLVREQDNPIGMLTSPKDEERAVARAAVRAAQSGDRAAQDAAAEMADQIAAVVDIVAWTIAPDLIVLGGGLEEGADLLIPLVRERLSGPDGPEVELAATAVGADAALTGAVRLALDSIDSDVFGPTIADAAPNGFGHPYDLDPIAQGEHTA